MTDLVGGRTPPERPMSAATKSGRHDPSPRSAHHPSAWPLSFLGGPGPDTGLDAVDRHGWLAAPGVGLSTVWKSPVASGTRA